MNKWPELTFGMIVLNGEPFVRYNLRTLYPFAYQIIVVEGAAPAAANIATADGHSTDDTLETLQAFKAHEDPDDKLLIITAEDEGHPNGFWPGEKVEQSYAYARRATSDYLWQVDVDEFYKSDDMGAVLKFLRDDPEITALSFKQITFWGGFDYVVDGWYLRRGAENYHRLFKWGPGYTYVTHRPPTVQNSEGQDLRDLKWIDGYKLAKRGIFLYHYSLLFPKQVVEKCKYYSVAEWAQRSKAQQWAQEVFMELQAPYRVHNVYDYPSWLEYYSGKHPLQINMLRSELELGRLNIATRATNDIERTLKSPWYRLGRLALKVVEPFEYRFNKAYTRCRHLGSRLLTDPRGSVRALKRKMSQYMELKT